MRLKGKVAIVTGSSRGIGRSIALAFAREGADVVVNYVRSKESAKEVASSIIKMGRKALVVKADVSDVEDVKRMVESTLKEFGKIDILVNNAADFSVMEFSLDNPDWNGWDRMMMVNTKGMLICSQSVSQHMLNQKSGNIINIVADWAGGGLCYMLTKAVGIPLTRGLARSLAPHVRVNALCPGSIDTGWISALPKEEQEKLKESTPLKRWGQPEDVAKVAVFLASNESDYITGATIIVDGGASINPWAP
ncbi:MAG: 3-oxoacyl-ACP reductase family protein [Candidatus Bathyarchaeia archaeon]|nr:3-oxoacyl-ACP reductase family protein [Candidatus Bathyarchaeia archaeon]